MPLPPDPYRPTDPDPVTITKKADAVSDARSYFFPLPSGLTVEVRIKAVGADAGFESNVRAFAEGCQELPVAAITRMRPKLLETA